MFKFSFNFSEDSFNFFQDFFRDFFLTSHSIGGPVVSGGLEPVEKRGGPVPPGGPVTFGGPSRMWKISGPSLLCADPWPATIFVAFFITFFLCVKTTIGPVRMGHDFRSNCRIKLRIYFLLGTHHYLIVVL